MKTLENPFLNQPFEVRWSELKFEHIEADITKGIEDSKLRIQEIADQDLGQVTYASTLEALEESTRELGDAWGYINHLDSVCNNDSLREVYNKMLPIVSGFFSSIALNGKLWNVIQAFSKTEEAQALTGVYKRHLDETIYSFEKAGANLSDDKKKEFEELNKELASITQKYSENVLDSTNAWEYVTIDVSELKGLPPMLVDAARQDALAKGHGTEDSPKWRLSLQMTSLGPALTYLDSDELRKKIWKASTAIGAKDKYDNTDLISKILRLREQKAKILGRENFADFATERRMAGSGLTALRFIEDIHLKVKEAFLKEVEELEQFKAQKLGQEPEHFQPWEMGYWSEKQRKALYDFDEEELRPYFPIQSVIKGMFDLAEELFGVQIKERPTSFDGQPCELTKEISGELAEVWHPEVRFYEVWEKDLHLGSFYADWHPRDSKRGGAWMNSLKTGGPKEGKYIPNLGLIAGNLTAPTKDKPALLNHREVETVFHEFGHLIHHLFGMVEVESLNGIHVAWDFVELPSQLMENFCWDRKSLDLFAKHYETGETIPEDLFQKMIAARNFGSASGTIRQLNFAKMDLELHINYDVQSSESIDSWLDRVMKEYKTPLKTNPPSIVRRFSHLFSSPTGYAAGYYSYKWAEVLDADAFTRFAEDGVISAKVGREFREKILSQGNSRDPMDLFVDFMGRKPDPDALLKRCGLLK